jgi:molecular chaperone DnaJ
VRRHRPPGVGNNGHGRYSAGVSEGNYLSVPGKGDCGLNSGPAGDLIVLIQEEKDKFFERHGSTLSAR